MCKQLRLSCVGTGARHPHPPLSSGRRCSLEGRIHRGSCKGNCPSRMALRLSGAAARNSQALEAWLATPTKLHGGAYPPHRLMLNVIEGVDLVVCIVFFRFAIQLRNSKAFRKMPNHNFAWFWWCREHCLPAHDSAPVTHHFAL